ncbi:glycoside hydrolase family 3 protein [Lyophyllum atratum]|nr:glycoside hydrolase family 3 protein [Lyophyllum atratum]
MTTLTDEVKREIGQHFVFGFHGHEVSEEIKTLIRDYHLGSVILMKRNVRDAKQVRRIVRELQAVAKDSGHEKPLLIGIDQENGLVSAFSSPTAGTQFPGAMALAATGSVNIAFDVSAATAKELKMVGINWAYSPVADVNSDSRNPVIGVRSFGDNPADVARYASAVARGLTSCGVAPSAKHFPGHGDTHVDSHLALPLIKKSKGELKESELVPFDELVHGVDPIASVMIGHMALPGLTGDATPASLSPFVTKALLREEMGYDGVVVTDCLEMDAIAEPLQGGCGVEEGAIRSIASGVDVVMVCHTFERHVGSIKSVYSAVEGGRLNLNELLEGGRRVGKMKDKFVGGWKEVLGNERDEATFEQAWKILKAENKELSRKAYQMSSAVVWGKDKLPLKIAKEKEIVLFTPTIETLNRAVDDADGVLRDPAGRLRNTAGPSYLALANQIQKRVQTRHIVYSPHDTGVAAISDNVGAVVFVMRNADRSVWQKQYMKKVLGAYKEIPVVLLASCGPYDLVGEEEVRDRTAYVASFEFREEAFEAFVGVVFDGVEGGGRVPVSV